jgi:hypothetical protein
MKKNINNKQLTVALNPIADSKVKEVFFKGINEVNLLNHYLKLWKNVEDIPGGQQEAILALEYTISGLKKCLQQVKAL